MFFECLCVLNVCVWANRQVAVLEKAAKSAELERNKLKAQKSQLEVHILF